MTTIVGADGCRTGWLCLFQELPTRRIGSKSDACNEADIKTLEGETLALLKEVPA